MRLHASVIVRRRSTLDSSFLGRRGVGRGHPTRLTSRLMRGVHDRTFAFSGRTSLQCANVQRARVNARSGTRTTQRKIGNGAFCHTSASTRGRRCNPLLATYHTSVCLRRAAYRAHISVPSYNRHLDSEEWCTNHAGPGGPCHTLLFTKCIAALATSFVVFLLDQSRAATTIMAHELPCPPTTTFSGSRASLI